MKKLIYAFLISFAFCTQSWGQSSYDESVKYRDITDILKTDSGKVDLTKQKTSDDYNHYFGRIRNIDSVKIIEKDSKRVGFFGGIRQGLKTFQYSFEVPFGKTAAFGVDEYVADKVEYSEFWNEETRVDKYGFKYTPIALNTPSKTTAQIKFLMEKNNWAIGVKWTAFATESKATGVINTPEPGINDNDTLYYHWLRSEIWNRNMGPLWNDWEKSGLSPIWYYFGNELKMTSVDVFCLWKIYQDAKNAVVLDFGAKFLKPYYIIEAGMQQHAHLNDYWGWEFDNLVTIKSRHESVFKGPFKKGFLKKLEVLMGPTVCASYERKIKFFAVSAATRFTVAMGNVRKFGDFKDVDDIKFYDYDTQETEPLYFDGYAYFKKTEIIIMPIIETELRIEYPVTNYFSIGVTSAYTIFFNFPLGPRWDNPWAQGAWITKTENVGIGASAMTFKISF